LHDNDVNDDGNGNGCGADNTNDDDDNSIQFFIIHVLIQQP
jgi:hypothetical protein